MMRAKYFWAIVIASGLLLPGLTRIVHKYWRYEEINITNKLQKQEHLEERMRLVTQAVRLVEQEAEPAESTAQCNVNQEKLRNLFLQYYDTLRPQHSNAMIGRQFLKDSRKIIIEDNGGLGSDGRRIKYLIDKFQTCSNSAIDNTIIMNRK